MNTKIENNTSKILGASIACALVVIVLALLSPEAAFGNISDVRDGVGATGEPPAGVDINSIIATVINIFSFIVGIIAVIMIIIGGLKYITSTGDSGKVDSAKNTILYAVIGLVIVAVAQIIVIFVLDTVENDDSSTLPVRVAQIDSSTIRTII